MEASRCWKRTSRTWPPWWVPACLSTRLPAFVRACLPQHVPACLTAVQETKEKELEATLARVRTELRELREPPAETTSAEPPAESARASAEPPAESAQASAEPPSAEEVDGALEQAVAAATRCTVLDAASHALRDIQSRAIANFQRIAYMAGDADVSSLHPYYNLEPQFVREILGIQAREKETVFMAAYDRVQKARGLQPMTGECPPARLPACLSACLPDDPCPCCCCLQSVSRG